MTLSLGLLLIAILVLCFFSSIVPSNVTGQPFLGTSQLSTGKKQLSMVLLNELKSIIFKQLGV
jgi:hypothetical protein